MKTMFHCEHLREGQAVNAFSQEGRAPDLITRPSADLGNLARRHLSRAAACIYCGSLQPRSREHVIPKAWGGTLVIQEGSCETCRKRTSGFEDRALNEGTMREVRRLRGWGSRSGHRHARDTLPFIVMQDGERRTVEVPVTEAPLLLGLPHFSAPTLLTGENRQTVGVEGWSLASFGSDPNAFLRTIGATELVFEEDGKRAVAFAQTLAKIAYSYAWCDGVFQIISGREALVKAFMHSPETLGQFVGSKTGPYEQAPPEVLFSLRYTLDPRTLHVLLEVHPFADVGGPTHLVVLGRCDTLREWRHVRRLVQLGFYQKRPRPTNPDTKRTVAPGAVPQAKIA